MESIGKNWWVLLVEGILLCILGIFAILIPQVSTFSFELVIGSLFIVGGFVQLFRAFQLRKEQVLWPSLLGALATLFVGWFMLAYPLKGIVMLSILLVAYLSFEGISKMLTATFLKPHYKSWGWIMTSGFVSLFLVAIILMGWPQTATWVLGLIVGVNMLTFGISLIYTSFDVKSIKSEVST